jgi:DNA-directed RNA polymerase subunit F
MDEDKRPYFKVTNVPPKLHQEIKQLAKSQEMTISKFVKSELAEIVKKYPDFMKKSEG